MTYDALPWIERCLDSLRGVETVVVDNGSRDGTVAFVRERYPDVRVIEAENRGLGAGWNLGIRETTSTYALLLNADAWLTEGALARLADFADTRPHAAVIGPRLLNCDEDYFLFSEETDWCFRFHEAGWEVVFFPGAECVHVRGASHSGRLYRENLRGHLLFLSKHQGPKVAERARRLLLASLRLRGLAFRGERGRAYRDGAAWLASADAATLVER